MSKLLDKFSICNKIPETLKLDIKCIHVFEDIKGHNILFITRDDQVYGLGLNYWGSLGLGHNIPVESPESIPELNHQNIREFICGTTFVLALTGDSQVLAWGYNDCGQLAREPARGGTTTYLKAERIAFFTNNKFITQLSCSYNHALALTSDGDVYGWGNNRRGQVGCGDVDDLEYIATPIRVKFTNNYKIKIKAIYCSGIHSSFALTVDGYVFSWGNNNCHHLGHDIPECVLKPQIITNIFNIQTVCPYGHRTYFLTNEGLVYFCGLHTNRQNVDLIQKTPKLSDIKHNFRDLWQIQSYHKDMPFITALKKHNLNNNKTNIVYMIVESNQTIETKYESFLHFYSNEFQLTDKTIHLKEWPEFDVKHETKAIEVTPKPVIKTSEVIQNNKIEVTEVIPKPMPRQRNPVKTQPIIEKRISNENMNHSSDSYYNNTFEELSVVGSGGFGTVYKVKHRFNQRLYAIKLIVLKESMAELNDRLLNETKNELKLRSEYVIQYTTSWLEDNNRLYIQMEYCSHSLHDILAAKAPVFGRQSPTKPMQSHEYYVSSELFRELLECVQYLHAVWPQVIHRGLKPRNILYTENAKRTGRFLKLSDFGLGNVFTAEHMDPKWTGSNKSDALYMAPEVIGSDDPNRFTTKSDVFSVGVIGQHVFDINIKDKKSVKMYEKTELNECFKQLWDVLTAMTAPDAVNRPECSQVLQNSIKWSISIPIAKNGYDLNAILAKTAKQNDYQFIHKYILHKIKS